MKHPSKSQLNSFAHGRGKKEFRQAVKAHIEKCEACRRQVKALAKETSPRRSREANPEADSNSIPDELKNHAVYQVVRQLASGGMGDVYLVTHRLTGRLEVVKVISPHLIERPEIRTRFLNEIRAAAALDHPNIVRTLTAFEDGCFVGLVMEYVQGDDLAELIRDQKVIEYPQACEFVIGVCDGLQYAASCKGIVHRDIKPANLLVERRNGGSEAVKILDFGLAKVISELSPQSPNATVEGKILGTPAYMSPEQAANPSAADARSDVYSLGCTLYELLTGKKPFEGSTPLSIITSHIRDVPEKPSSVRNEIPQVLDHIVMRMIEKSPEHRFQAASDVAEALREFLAASSNAKNTSVRFPTDAENKFSSAKNTSGDRQFFPVEHRGSIARRFKKKSITSRILSLIFMVVGPFLISGLLYFFYADQLTQFVKEAYTAREDSYIVLEDLPRDVVIQIDRSPADFSRPTANSPPRISAQPGSYLLSVVRSGRVLFEQRIQVEPHRDVVVHVSIPETQSTPLDGVLSVQDNEAVKSPPDQDHESYPNGSFGLTASDVAIAIKNAKEKIKSRDAAKAVELLDPLLQLELPQSPLVERLHAAARAIGYYRDTVSKTLRIGHPPDSFFAGTIPVFTEVKALDRREVILRVGKQTKTFQAESLPFVLEQYIFAVSSESSDVNSHLSEAVAYVTSKNIKNGYVQLSTRMRAGEFAQLVDDLEVDDPQALIKAVEQPSTSSTHEPMELLTGTSGALERVIVFRQGSIFGNQQSVLASYSGDSSTLVWNINSGEKELFKALTTAPTAVAASLNGRIFATLEATSEDFRLKLFEMPTQKKLAEFNDLRLPVADFELSSDGRLLTRVDGREAVREINLQSGRETRATGAASPFGSKDLRQITIDPTTTYVASANNNGGLSVWNAGDGRELGRIETNLDILGLFFSSDGSQLIAVSSTGRFSVFETRGLSPVVSFWGHNWDVTSLSRSLNRRYLITADSYSNVRVWDTKDMSLVVAVFEGHPSEITAVGFETTTENLAIGFADSTLRVWKPKSSESFNE